MFKRTTQSKSVKSTRPLPKKTNIFKYENNHKFVVSNNEKANLTGGILKVKSLIIGRNDDIEIKKVVNMGNDNSSTDCFNLEYTGTSLTIKDLWNGEPGDGAEVNRSFSYCNITVKGGSKSVNGTSTTFGTYTNPVVLNLPNAFNDATNNTIINWNLYDSSSGSSIILPDYPNDIKAKGTYVKVYISNKIENDSITITNSATSATYDSSSTNDFKKAQNYILFKYLEYYRRDYYGKDKSGNDIVVQINVADETQSSGKKYTIQAYKVVVDSDGNINTDTPYDGTIYYPFRGNPNEQAKQYNITKDDIIIFNNPVIFGYTEYDKDSESDELKKYDIDADPLPTDDKPIQVLGNIMGKNSVTYPIEYQYPVIFGSNTQDNESVGVLPNIGLPINNQQLLSIRYNKNYIQQVTSTTSGGKTTYSTKEVPANKWIIDEGCQFGASLRYKSGASSLINVEDEKDPSDDTKTIYYGYTFGESELEITGKGELASIALTGKQIGSIPVLNVVPSGWESIFDINLQGVKVTLKEETETETDENGTTTTTHNATIECNTLTI